MAQKFILSLSLCLGLACAAEAKDYETVSPDGKLVVKLHTGGGTQFEVWYHGEQVLKPSPIGLHLSNGTLVGGGEVTDVKKDRVRGTVDVVAGKEKTLREAYNEVVLSYGEDYELVVRAYDEGWAYRFVTHYDGEITIDKEDAVYNFSFKAIATSNVYIRYTRLRRTSRRIAFPSHQYFSNIPASLINLW